MGQLRDALMDTAKRTVVIRDCVLLIDAEVAGKGLTGIPIKAGYAAVKAIKPGFVDEVIEKLLPEFADAMEPIYNEGRAKSRIADHLTANSSRVANALLGVTDAKAREAKSGVVKATYERLRGIAQKHVEAAIPRLSKLVEKHAP